MIRQISLLLLIPVVTLQGCFWSLNSALADVTDAAEEICDSFEKLAISGNSNAQIEIANCYVYGYGREKDFGEAEKWLVQAVESGSDTARVSLSALILFKVADESRYAEAVRMLEAPASGGNAKAAFALYLAHRNGMGVPVDAAASLRQLDRAASEDHLVARFVVLGQLILGERRPDGEHGAEYWRGKLSESMASRGISSIEAFKEKVKTDDLITGFIFSQADVEKILEQL